MVNHKMINRITGGIIFLTVLGVYLKTVAPTVSFWDCGEFIASAYIMGVPHPPGTPLYVLIGRLFSLLPIGGEIAWRVNIISSVSSALAVLMIYLVTVRLILFWSGIGFSTIQSQTEGLSQDLSLTELIPAYAGGAMAAFCVAFSDTFWFNAVEAEVYGSSVLVTMLAVWLSMLWMERHDDHESDKILLFIAYLFGLGSGMHLLSLLTIPSILILILFTNARPLKNPKLWIAAISLFILGWSTVFALYIRSGLNPAIDENNPENFRNFMQFLQRKQYGQESLLVTLFNRKSDFWGFQVWHMFMKYFFQQFPLPDVFPFSLFSRISQFRKATANEYMTVKISLIPYILGIAGMYVHLRKDWKRALAFVVLFVIMGFGLVVYLNMQDPQPRERDYFFVGAFTIFAMWIGIALSGILDWLVKRIRRLTGIAYAVIALVVLIFLAVPAAMSKANYHSHDRTGDYVSFDYGYNIIQSCDKDAILFTNGDNDTFPLWFLQEVMQIRKDIKVVNLSLLNTPWYIKQLRDFEPKIKIEYSDNYIDNVLCGSTAEAVMTRKWDKERFEKAVAAGMKWKIPSPGGNYNILRIQDVMVYNIIHWNKWERPVYFAVTAATSNMIGLKSAGHLIMEGMVFRVMKDKVTSYRSLDPERSKHNLWNVYQYRGLKDPEVYKDANTLKLLANYRAAYLQLADVYRVMRRPDEAVETLERCDELVPMYWVDYRVSSQILAAAGRREAAGEFLEKGLEDAKKKGTNALLQIASSFITDAQNYDRAVKVYTEVTEVSPFEKDAYYGLALALEKKQDYKASLETLEHLLELFPEDEKAKSGIEGLKKLADVEKEPGDAGNSGQSESGIP